VKRIVYPNAQVSKRILENTLGLNSLQENLNMNPSSNEPQSDSQIMPCSSCSDAFVGSTEFVYAAGYLKVHFPSLGLEKEFEAAAKLLNTSPRDYYTVFTHTDDKQGNQPYRYIAEQVSWIMSIDNNEVYVLLPQTIDELNEFIDSLKVSVGANISDESQCVAIGVLGPIAPDDLRTDLPLRMILCNHLFHFTTEDILDELKGDNTTTVSIRDVLDALTIKPNIGASAAERAKNFLAYRYSTIYSKTTSLSVSNSKDPDDGAFLESLEAKSSDGSPGRTIVDIIFNYQKNVSGRQQAFFVSVDVTDQYPFLHSNLSDYIATN